MGKKLLKKSFVTGAVVASLLSTSAFAFASTDAGEQVKTWAGGKIDSATGAIAIALGLSTSLEQGKIAESTSNKQGLAVTEVNRVATIEKEETISSIESKLQEHILSLQAAFEAYRVEVGGDFDAFVTIQNNLTKMSMEDQLATLTAQVESVMADSQTTSVSDVTNVTQGAKAQARQDLIDEINRVKGLLTQLIASEQATAQSEVNAYLANQVNRLTNTLTTLINTLETNAKNAIGTAGFNVESSADANFDRVISRLQAETPITVDPQKITLKKIGIFSGKMVWEVTNTNEFDVVFKWALCTKDGVNETAYKEEGTNNGKTRFTTPTSLENLFIYISWQDENGVWQKARPWEIN